MNTELLVPTRLGDLGSDEAILRAAELLRAGQLVAFPTETVYGLGARADSDAAIARIYEAKNRPAGNPLIVHVPDAAQARGWAEDWTDEAELLARKFWPGPLTIVVRAAKGLSPLALAGGVTVGLRAPRHPVALALLRACGLPLAAPSANLSGAVSPTTARDVVETLGGRIAAVLDGGACAVGIESTVLDLVDRMPRVLRPGAITPAMIARVLGREVASGPAGNVRDAGAAMRSPGLMARHYAPSIPLRLIEPRGTTAAAMHGEAHTIRFDGAEVSFDDTETRLTRDPARAAAALYGALHHAERSGAREIQVENPPAGEEWDAVRDRLRRAATPAS